MTPDWKLLSFPALLFLGSVSLALPEGELSKGAIDFSSRLTEQVEGDLVFRKIDA